MYLILSDSESSSSDDRDDQGFTSRHCADRCHVADWMSRGFCNISKRVDNRVKQLWNDRMQVLPKMQLSQQSVKHILMYAYVALWWQELEIAHS